mgnify:FL=1
MTNFITSKKALEDLIEQNKSRLTNEEYEYLQSLINLEFSFLKYYLKSKNKSSILNDKLFYEAAIFNIYEKVSEALKKIQSVRIISFAENQECKSVSTCISSLLIPSKESSKQEIFKLFNIEKSTDYKNPFEISIFSYGELYLNEIPLPEYLVEVIEKRKQISALSSNIIFKSLEINQYKGFKYNSNIIESKPSFKRKFVEETHTLTLSRKTPDVVINRTLIHTNYEKKTQF